MDKLSVNSYRPYVEYMTMRKADNPFISIPLLGGVDFLYTRKRPFKAVEALEESEVSGGQGNTIPVYRSFWFSDKGYSAVFAQSARIVKTGGNTDRYIPMKKFKIEVIDTMFYSGRPWMTLETTAGDSVVRCMAMCMSETRYSVSEGRCIYLADYIQSLEAQRSRSLIPAAHHISGGRVTKVSSVKQS